MKATERQKDQLLKRSDLTRDSMIAIKHQEGQIESQRQPEHESRNKCKLELKAGTITLLLLRLSEQTTNVGHDLLSLSRIKTGVEM